MKIFILITYFAYLNANDELKDNILLDVDNDIKNGTYNWINGDNYTGQI